MSELPGLTRSERCDRKPMCQVPGCNSDLTAEAKQYFRQRHICRPHLQAQAIYCPGSSQPLRFCMQCGKLEPLGAFDGQKRSCRAKLNKRKERRSSQNGSTLASSKRSSSPNCCCNHSVPAAPSGSAPDVAAQQNHGLTSATQDGTMLAYTDAPPAWCDAHSILAHTAADAPAPVSISFAAQQQQQQQQEEEEEELLLLLMASIEGLCHAEGAALSSTTAAATAAGGHVPALSFAPGCQPVPPKDDFEALLFSILEQELAASTGAEYACGSGGISSSNSNSPLLAHMHSDSPAFSPAPGASEVLPVSHGLTLPLHGPGGLVCPAPNLMDWCCSATGSSGTMNTAGTITDSAAAAGSQAELNARLAAIRQHVEGIKQQLSVLVATTACSNLPADAAESFCTPACFSHGSVLY